MIESSVRYSNLIGLRRRHYLLLHHHHVDENISPFVLPPHLPSQVAYRRFLFRGRAGNLIQPRRDIRGGIPVHPSVQPLDWKARPVHQCHASVSSSGVRQTLPSKNVETDVLQNRKCSHRLRHPSLTHPTGLRAENANTPQDPGAQYLPAWGNVRLRFPLLILYLTMF